MKPKIFVSSTVIDFEDMRSAIKYYLEQYGFEVQMSEYPTFDVDHDKSTVDACLKNLERCEYFILLIGYRRGSWYKQNEISVTHMEYKTAKKLAESGHPIRIISFVRKPIWLLKNDRESLVKHFVSKSEELSKEIASIGSTIIDDPNYIFNFINEISEGIKIPDSDLTVNNWIYDFDGFEDIASALQNTLKLGLSLAEKKQMKLLINELITNYESFLIHLNSSLEENESSTGLVKFPNILYYYKERLYPQLISIYDDVLLGRATYSITGAEISNLLLYAIIFPQMKKTYNLSTSILEKVLDEGFFLRYEVSRDEYETTPIHFGLQKLLEWILNFKKLTSSTPFSEFTKEISILSSNGSAHNDTISLSKNAAVCIMALKVANRIPDLIKLVLEYFKTNDDSKIKKFDYSDKYK